MEFNWGFKGLNIILTNKQVGQQISLQNFLFKISQKTIQGDQSSSM